MLVVDFAGEVRGDQSFVVGMGDDDQNIGLQARIGRAIVGAIRVEVGALGMECTASGRGSGGCKDKGFDCFCESRSLHGVRLV